MRKDQVRAGWAAIPLRQRTATIAIVPLAVWSFLLFGSRRLLSEGLGDLNTESDPSVKSRGSALDKLIQHDRDALLTGALVAIEGQLAGKSRTVSVVYGAGHIIAAVRSLGALGYSPVSDGWLKVW